MGDLGDMGEMAEGTTTPAEPTAGTNAGGTATPAANQDTGGVNSVEVQGTLREWAIDLSQQEIPAGMVVFTVSNEGQFAHNFAVQDSTGVIGKTPTFSKADGAQTLELELAPGTYNIICTLPGHASRGQQTTLVVK
jgi:plastocyanin